MSDDFIHWPNSLYWEYDPTEIYANIGIIDVNILVRKMAGIFIILPFIKEEGKKLNRNH